MHSEMAFHACSPCQMSALPMCSNHSLHRACKGHKDHQEYNDHKATQPKDNNPAECSHHRLPGTNDSQLHQTDQMDLTGQGADPLLHQPKKAIRNSETTEHPMNSLTIINRQCLQSHQQACPQASSQDEVQVS